MTAKIPPRHGSHGASHASLAKRIERGEGVALKTETPSPAQTTAVLFHRLPYLYRCAYRLLGNTADAEDAVQDALLAAFKHLNQFRGEAQLSTSVTTIVINCARMHLRKSSRYVHVSLDSRIGEERKNPLTLWWITGLIPRMSATGLGRMRA